MNRTIALLIGLNAALAAAVLGLWLESRNLRAELAVLTAPPAPQAPVPLEKAELHAVIRAEQDRNAILQSDVAGLRRRLEALEARSGPRPDAPATGRDAAAPAPEKGASLDADVVRHLALSPEQAEAVNRILSSERERFTAAARNFFADHVDRAMPGLFDMTLAQLLRAFWSEDGALAEDWRAWWNLHPIDHQRVLRGDSTYEELLGPENRVWILHRTLHVLRLKTHAELSAWLSTDQIETFRRDLLPEGDFSSYGARFAIGFAPPGLRKEVLPPK